jgi:hypothetical protein
VLSDSDLHEAQALAEQEDKPLGAVLVEGGYLTQQRLDELESQRQQMPVGLMDAAGRLPLEACVSPVDTTGLDVLPAGVPLNQGAGSLSPAALHQVIEAARSQYDVILMDTGPVLGSLEASMVATEADGVVFIVSRGDQKSLAMRSLDALHSISATVSGIVFNQADEADMQRSSYTAASFSQGSRTGVRSRNGSRRGGDKRAASRRPLLPRDQTRRYGPLASAVVACDRDIIRSGQKSGERAKSQPTQTATANGNGNGKS